MNFIVETKNEYTIQLVNILAPLIYEGFDSIYLETKKIIKKGDENKLLKTFQQFISKIPSWNDNMINNETKRIITQSRCEWLTDLLKAVIKSNIILLSNSNPIMDGKFIINEDYLNIPLNQFIHKCYIECARQIYSTPDLFYHNINPINRKRNQRESLEIIKNAVKEAIRKMLPVQYILREYLGNEYKPSNNELDRPLSLNDSDNLKNLVSKDLKNYVNPNVMQNFKNNDNTKNTTIDTSDDICDDKETINLLSEIKKKYNSGQLLKVTSEKTGGVLSNNNSSTPTYRDLHLLNKSGDNKKSISSNSNKHLISSKSDSNKNLTSSKKLHDTESIKEDSIKEESIKVDSIKEDSIKKNIIEEDSIGKDSIRKNSIDNNSIKSDDISIISSNSVTYRIEHDSEYEAVFSNINKESENNDIKSDKEKKKRKDSYFSNFNNI